MPRQVDPLHLMASLCDAMKRLESAIAADAPDDRAYYLEECAARRKRVERSILSTARPVKGTADGEAKSD